MSSVTREDLKAKLRVLRGMGIFEQDIYIFLEILSVRVLQME